MQADEALATKRFVALVEAASVAGNPGFENEQGVQAVAKIFLALEAEPGAGLCAAGDFVTCGGGARHIAYFANEAHICDAVDLNG